MDFATNTPRMPGFATGEPLEAEKLNIISRTIDSINGSLAQRVSKNTSNEENAEWVEVLSGVSGISGQFWGKLKNFVSGVYVDVYSGATEVVKINEVNKIDISSGQIVRCWKNYDPIISGALWHTGIGGRKDTRTVRLSGWGHPSGWIGYGTGEFEWEEDTTGERGKCWITHYNENDGTPNSFLWARPDNIQIDWGYNKVPDGLGGFKWQSGWYWYPQVLGNSNGWKPDEDPCSTLPQPGATLFGIMNPDPTANPGGPYDGFDEVKYLNRSFFDDTGKALNVNRRKWKGDQYGNIVEIYEEETAFTISSDEEYIWSSGEGECGLEDTKLGLKLYHYSGAAFSENIPGVTQDESSITITPYNITTNSGQHTTLITALTPIRIPIPSGAFDSDEKVAVWTSGTPGYLQDVLLAGTGITLSGSGTNALTIHCTVVPDAFTVKNDNADPTPGFLDEKLKYDNTWIDGVLTITGSGNYTTITHINNSTSGFTTISGGKLEIDTGNLKHTSNTLVVDSTGHYKSGAIETQTINGFEFTVLEDWTISGTSIIKHFRKYHNFTGDVSGWTETIAGTDCET